MPQLSEVRSNGAWPSWMIFVGFYVGTDSFGTFLKIPGLDKDILRCRSRYKIKYAAVASLL